MGRCASQFVEHFLHPGRGLGFTQRPVGSY